MSADRLHTYKLLAELLEYPTSRTPATAKLCAMFLADRCPAAAREVESMSRAVESADIRDLEERYSAVFDFHPTRTLDLGYQLFGETYKRGVFLVLMKESAAAHGVDTGSELPDHLPNVLRLLADLSAEEDPRDLADEVILPAVEKILRTFEDDAGGYRAALSAVKSLLMTDFGIDHVEPAKTPEEPRFGDALPASGRRLPMFPGFHSPAERVLS